MKTYANAIRLVAVNLIVLVVLLGGIEFYFRHWGHERQDKLLNGLWQTFQPYVMITTAPGDYREFFNTFTKETYPSSVRTNSLGYMWSRRHRYRPHGGGTDGILSQQPAERPTLHGDQSGDGKLDRVPAVH